MSINLQEFDPVAGRRVEILNFEGNLVGEHLSPETLTDDLIRKRQDDNRTQVGELAIKRSAFGHLATSRVLRKK